MFNKDTVSLFFKQLKSKGIEVLNTYYETNNYCRQLSLAIREKYSKLRKGVSNILPKEQYPLFYDEYYSEDYAIRNADLEQFFLKRENGISRLRDVQGKYLNVTMGERKTAGQPAQYDKTVYFFGACNFVGSYVEDSHTIESFLQKFLNEDGYQIRVVNCASFCAQLEIYGRIFQTGLKKGDVLVIHDYELNQSMDGVFNLNFADIAEKEKIEVSWVVDNILHSNYKVNKLYAKAIYNELKTIWRKKTDNPYSKDMEKNHFFKEYAKKYASEYRDINGFANGCIVITADPYTYEQKELLNIACNQVEKLFVFVEEEGQNFLLWRKRFQW